jgi:hypothetical protein
MRKTKFSGFGFGVMLVALLVTFFPGLTAAASIYNSDFKAQKIEIKYSNGEEYIVTVYNSSTHYFDCKTGCLVKVLRTGYTKSSTSDTVLVIDDGKLRVK